MRRRAGNLNRSGQTGVDRCRCRTGRARRHQELPPQRRRAARRRDIRAGGSTRARAVSTLTTSTRSRSNPSGTAVNRCSVLTKRPAATTSTSDNATCAMTRALAPPRQSPVDAPRRPFLQRLNRCGTRGSQRRCRPSQYRRHRRERHREHQDANSRAAHRARRDRWARTTAATTARLPHMANSRPPAAPTLGEDEAFDEHLPCEPPARRSEGQPHAQLVPARRRTRELEVGDVRARRSAGRAPRRPAS